MPIQQLWWAVARAELAKYRPDGTPQPGQTPNYILAEAALTAWLFIACLTKEPTWPG